MVSLFSVSISDNYSFEPWIVNNFEYFKEPCWWKILGDMVIAQFRPFEMNSIPIEEKFMNWKELVKQPYNKKSVDAYTRTRIILMNGIENASVLMSHAMERMTVEPEIKRQMAAIRRVDSMQQQTVNWLNPADRLL